jgi:hypothetical protein
MKVVLARKLADSMDDVDVSGHEVGDVLDLPSRQARSDDGGRLGRDRAPHRVTGRHNASSADTFVEVLRPRPWNRLNSAS